MINKIYRSVVKHIASTKFGGAVIGGEKLSANKFKDHVVNDVLKKRSLSPYELEEILKDEGMDKSQLSKRKKFIRMISGNEEKKLTPKEEILLREKIKARIAASRYTSEKVGEHPGGMAGQLRSRDKKSTLDKVLTTQANDEKGGKVKIGAGAIGIQGRNYNVTAHAGGRSISSTNKSGFANTPSQATGLTGDHGAGHIPQSGTHNPLR